VFFGHLDIFLWKRSVQFFCTCLYWVTEFGGVQFFDLPLYSGFQSLVICVAVKDFFLILCQPLQFRDHFFCCSEAFKFHVVPLVNPFS
jgi:hypothetical protein